MASAAYALLITLCNVWSLTNGAVVAVPDVVVTCSEEALLPCKILQDSSVTNQAVSWYKMSRAGDEIAWKVLDVESGYPKGLGGSLQLSNNTFQLRIRNATSQDSGTYKCILGEQTGDHNLSGIITLKVTGCPGIEDEKLKKYKTELFMLTCLGIFYLLLIFFTCTCLRKESMSPSDKNRRDSKHTLNLINAHEMTTFRVLNSGSTCKSGLTSSSI